MLMDKQEVSHVLQVDRSGKVRLTRCFVVASGLLWDWEIEMGCGSPEEEGEEATHQAMSDGASIIFLRDGVCTIF